jgi:hypothetical protein
VETKSHYETRPIHLAAKFGHLDCLKALVKHNANILVKDIDGATPWQCANSKFHPDCATYLYQVEMEKQKQLPVGGGDVYTFGEGTEGQLGHGDLNNHLQPRLVQALVGQRMIQVSAGDQHCVGVTEHGEILSWGTGRSGQLGMGYKRNLSIPLLVQPLHSLRVLEVACGSNHSLVLTECKGHRSVYSWGSGSVGQLGLGDGSDQAYPRLITQLEKECIFI